MTNTKKPENKSTLQKKNTLILALMLLLLITLFLVQCQLEKIKNNATQEQEAQTALLLKQKYETDSLRRSDSLEAIELKLASEYLVDSIRISDSLAQHQATVLPSKKDDSTQRLLKQAAIDSLKAVKEAEALIRDSLEKIRIRDSLHRADTIPPEAFLTPPAGRYYEPIRLKVKCDEVKCKTWLSFGDTNQIQDGSSGIEYNKTGVVFFRAEDSLGNLSAWEKGNYDMASDNRCGKNGFAVPVGKKEICVDAYEYPNIADEIPKDMVSHEQAANLCEKAGKRLCSIEEWQAACRGKEKVVYSYGNTYHPFKCNTNTKKVMRSGRKEQCRSWWGMHDMNGNLWEWTSSPSPQKSGMFLVAGGAWNGNNLTQCKENKFSFYPQNQYPYVGFRCCKDAP
ncbi:MAG TPA: SUMF1/EgtB/PvdO family nonheme iron enzyme [Fibrobacter sp.]|nr:SUMF1/EgtB/PvdO family nonheme iron enzyme [Fibrobacter sp.]